MNCLSHALDRWHEHGGYLLVRRSSHWGMPHVLTVTPEGLQHFAPGATLGHPAQSLVGFDGVAWDRDLADAPPMPVHGIVLGSLLLFVGACGWAVRRAITRMWR